MAILSKKAVDAALKAQWQEAIEELRLEYPNRLFVPWADALAESAGLVFPTDRATGETPDPADEMVLDTFNQEAGRPLTPASKSDTWTKEEKKLSYVFVFSLKPEFFLQVLWHWHLICLAQLNS